MVVSELLAAVCGILHDSTDTPMLDSRLIVKHVTGLDDVHLIIDKKKAVSDLEAEHAFRMAELRAKHMPIAYILGFREFMSLIFKVCPGVLIPRPDTECIVEEAIKLVKSGNILDIGTGSGAIAVSLAYYIPKARVSALDVSELALSIASDNAKSNNVNVDFINADIFSYKTDEKYDLIISNPPYISTDEIDGLMPDVQAYEPHMALDGGADGLDFYKKITEFATEHLNPGGYLIYEFGWRQHDNVRKILESSGFEFINSIKDLSGIKRGLAAKKDGSITNEKVFS